MCQAQSPAPFSPEPCRRLACSTRTVLCSWCLAKDSQDSHCRTELLGTGSWGRGLRGGGLGAGAGAEKSWKEGGGKEDEDDEGRLRVREGRRMERWWWWVTE